MKVTIILIMIGALGIVSEGLLKGLDDLEIRGRVETIQTLTLPRTARILRRVLETWGNLLLLNLQWKTICRRQSEKLSQRKHNNNHHHHVTLPARISLTLYRHPSLSPIAPGWPSRLHPVSAQNCCIKVLAGNPAYARSCEEVHLSMSLMSSSLRLQECPACLLRLIWIVFVMPDRCPYSCCFVGCCLYDLFNIARSILV